MPQRGAGASRKRGGAGGGLGPRAGNGGGRLSVRKMRGSHTTQPLPWLPHALCKNTEKMRKTGRHHAICRQTGTKPHHNGHVPQPRGYSFMNIRMLPNVRRKKTFSGGRRYFQELEGGRRRKKEVEDICWRKKELEDITRKSCGLPTPGYSKEAQQPSATYNYLATCIHSHVFFGPPAWPFRQKRLYLWHPSLWLGQRRKPNNHTQ